MASLANHVLHPVTPRVFQTLIFNNGKKTTVFRSATGYRLASVHGTLVVVKETGVACGLQASVNFDINKGAAYYRSLMDEGYRRSRCTHVGIQPEYSVRNISVTLMQVKLEVKFRKAEEPFSESRAKEACRMLGKEVNDFLTSALGRLGGFTLYDIEFGNNGPRYMVPPRDGDVPRRRNHGLEADVFLQSLPAPTIASISPEALHVRAAHPNLAVGAAPYTPNLYLPTAATTPATPLPLAPLALLALPASGVDTANITATTPAITPMPPAQLAQSAPSAPVVVKEPTIQVTIGVNAIEEAAQGDKDKEFLKLLFKTAVMKVKGKTKQHGPSWWEVNISTILSHLPEAHFNKDLKEAITEAYKDHIKFVRHQQRKTAAKKAAAAAGVKAEGQ